MKKRRWKMVSLLLSTVVAAGTLSACGIGSIGSSDFTLNKTAYTMEKGATTKLTPQTKGNPNRSSFQWESSDPTVATVDDGTVKAVDEGSATITATDNHGKSSSCDITVKKIEVDNISLNKQSTTIKKGKGFNLEATVNPSDADTDDMQWQSSNEAVAIVNSSGYVTGVGKGSANITCELDGKSAACTVTVKAKKKKTTSTNTGNNNNNTGGSSNNGSTKTVIVQMAPADEIADDYPDDFIFPYSSEEYLSESDVEYLSIGETQQAINEIYARNGYSFDNPAWQQFFGKYSWYHPYKKVSTAEMNSVEKANIKLLAKHRKAIR